MSALIVILDLVLGLVLSEALMPSDRPAVRAREEAAASVEAERVERAKLHETLNHAVVQP